MARASSTLLQHELDGIPASQHRIPLQHLTSPPHAQSLKPRLSPAHDETGLPDASPSPNVVAGVALLCSFLTAIDDLWKPPLDGEALAHMQVRRETLNLASGTASFLRPIPLDQMSHWIEEKKPWLERGHGCSRDEGLCRWWNARGRAGNLCCYAESAGNNGEVDMDLDGILEDYSQWTDYPPVGLALGDFQGGKNVHSSYDNKFTMLTVYHCKDNKLPHTTGVLCSSAKLGNDTLDRIELRAVIHLAGCRMIDLRYENQLIPFTLISWADCQCRVIIGHFDITKKCLHLQQSRLVNFDYTGHHDSDDWKRVMCWMLAEPIGDTSVGTV